MKKVCVLFLTFVFCVSAAYAYISTNKVLYLDDLRNLADFEASNRIMVAAVPLTHYVIYNNETNINVFFDFELKVSECKNPIPNSGEFIESGVVMNYITMRLILSTFNTPLNLYLDPLKKNAFAIYYYDSHLGRLERLQLEHYDSMLEQIVAIRGYTNISAALENFLPSVSYAYVVIDGTRVDPNMEWFFAGNKTIEAHMVRLHPWSDFEKNSDKKPVWGPVEVHWYSTVPNFLSIPTINWNNADSAFWRIWNATSH